MVKGIIGKKVGMTQLFDANGKVVPVTVIEAETLPAWWAWCATCCCAWAS